MKRSFAAAAAANSPEPREDTIILLWFGWPSPCCRPRGRRVVVTAAAARPPCALRVRASTGGGQRWYARTRTGSRRAKQTRARTPSANVGFCACASRFTSSRSRAGRKTAAAVAAATRYFIVIRLGVRLRRRSAPKPQTQFFFFFSLILIPPKTYNNTVVISRFNDNNRPIVCPVPERFTLFLHSKFLIRPPKV